MPFTEFAKGKNSTTLRNSIDNAARGSSKVNWPVVWFCEQLQMSSYGLQKENLGYYNGISNCPNWEIPSGPLIEVEESQNWFWL